MKPAIMQSSAVVVAAATVIMLALAAAEEPASIYRRQLQSGRNSPEEEISVQQPMRARRLEKALQQLGSESVGVRHLFVSAGILAPMLSEDATTTFTSIQAAIDAVPFNNNVRTFIHVAPGIYQERVVVPSTKPFITLLGSGMTLTYVQWHLKASDTDEHGVELTAYNTASVTVYASNFVAKDITFKNTLPPPPPGIEGRQAAAFRISGDMAAFYRCGFEGGQDTLCDDQGRHYFEDCFIQGSIDFIFGDARSFYSRCQLNSIAQQCGSIAAQDRQSLDDNTGFAFVNCTVTGNGPLYLGRAMGPFSRIIFAYSYFDNIIVPRGWDDWDHETSKDSTVYFGEYKCEGPGANQVGRVGWSHEIRDEDVSPFLTTSFINAETWLVPTE